MDCKHKPKKYLFKNLCHDAATIYTDQQSTKKERKKERKKEKRREEKRREFGFSHANLTQFPLVVRPEFELIETVDDIA
jgi:hypothetical protein